MRTLPERGEGGEKTPPMKLIVLVTLLALLSLVADYFVKLAVETGGRFAAAAIGTAIVFNTAFTIGLFYALRHLSLSAFGVYFALLSMLMLTAIGVLAFGERLHNREIAGLALATLAILCMSRFT